MYLLANPVDWVPARAGQAAAGTYNRNYG
jgi:hypothetical protein